MKLNDKFTNYKIYIIFLIILIFIYHYFIQNGLEKIFSQTYFGYENVRRPLENCKKSITKAVGCLGMPSGHAETSTIVSCLLYYYKFIPLWVTMVAIFLFSIQRIIVNVHTPIQVIMGIIFGFLYSQLYFQFNLSKYAFLTVFLIGLILAILCVNKIDKQVYGPIPKWVDKIMIPSIKKKQESTYYLKVLSIYANSYLQNKTFISWEELENYLDIIIEKIRQQNIEFDSVVGIKTGGAIISDYISKKLNIPNYKVKLTRSEYNCNKKPSDTMWDMIYRHIFKVYGEYTVCEGIEDNLEGKNIILIDEMVASGTTMMETINYLRNEKHVNILYPTSISLDENRYKKDIHIDYVIPKSVIIWPWGYDN